MTLGVEGRAERAVELLSNIQMWNIKTKVTIVFVTTENHIILYSCGYNKQTIQFQLLGPFAPIHGP